MLAALVLICSVAITPDLRDCTRANATAVVHTALPRPSSKDCTLLTGLPNGFVPGLAQGPGLSVFGLIGFFQLESFMASRAALVQTIFKWIALRRHTQGC